MSGLRNKGNDLTRVLRKNTDTIYSDLENAIERKSPEELKSAIFSAWHTLWDIYAVFDKEMKKNREEGLKAIERLKKSARGK